MKKNSIWRKVLAVILSAVILIGGFMSNDMFSPVVSAEIINSTTISIGDSITLGTYNNKKMTWTCIAVDDNGALMLASEIICTKEYDASGKSQEYHSESWGYVRESYGSNCWQDSNIRQWLNSFGSVNYSHCSPSYATEKGFLSCFSNEELAYISDTTQKTYVNEWETHRNGYVDGGNKETNDYDISNVENAYYKNLTDKFFLLGQEQIMEGQKNVPNILRIGKEYFTRMANNTGASYENVITVKGLGNDYSVSIDTNGLGYKNATTLCGIRPAFYLKNNIQTYRPEIKTDDEFPAYVEEHYNSPDHFVADSIIYGLNGSNSIYDLTINSEVTPMYELIAEEVVKDTSLMFMSTFWKEMENFLDFDIVSMANWKETFYEMLLMDYLAFSCDDEKIESEFAVKSAKYATKLLKGYLESQSAIYHVDEAALEEIIEVENSEFADFCADIGTVLDIAELLHGGINEASEKIGKVLAYQDICESKINLLKKIRTIASDDIDLCTAVNNTIYYLNQTEAELTIEMLFTKGIKYGLRFLLQSGWNKLVDYNINFACSVVSEYSSESILAMADLKTELLAVQLGTASCDFFFNSDSNADANLKMAILYILDKYFKIAVRESKIDYLNNSTQAISWDFVETYRNYLYFQKYSTFFTKQFANQALFEGAWNKLKNLFSNTNNDLYNEIVSHFDTDVNKWNTAIKMTSQFYSIYDGLIRSATPSNITLSFNTDGGSEIGNISIDKTGSYGNLPIPTKQGYQFIGWSLTSTNTNSTHFVKNTSVYFYAPNVWRSNGAKIYCHLWNTDSKQSLFPWKNENEICEYIGGNIYRYVIPTGSNLNGIIFASSNGFQTYDLALGTICEDDVVYCLNRLSDNLYESAWKVNTEFKSIRSNTLGTYPLSNGMVDVDNIPVSGYKFVTSNIQVALPKDHTLYAIWEANTYTVSYNMNGGSGSIGNQIKKYGQNLTLSSVIPLRTDYRFLGWSTDKNAVTVQYNVGDQYTSNNDITLYAIWRIDHDYTTEIINPTCTLQGYTLHTCKNCNDSYKDTYTNALGHDYQLINQKPATCTTNGEKIYTCSRCGDTKTEIINATGHSYTTKVIAPTCTERGYTLHTCTNCDNSYKDNYTNVLGHDYKLTSQNSATCTTNGEKIYTCSRCGDIKTEIINATGHSYTTKVVDPTCTAKGYTLHTCKNCNDNYKDTYTNALGHDYKLTSEKAATCTTDGEKIYTCNRCGDTKTETVKATGHSYTTKVIASICTEKGYTLHTCSKCGNSYTDNYTNPTGHNYSNPIWTWSENYDETNAVLVCTKCNAVQTLNADITSEITEATYEADGKIIYTATVNFNDKAYSDIKTIVIPKKELSSVSITSADFNGNKTTVTVYAETFSAENFTFPATPYFDGYDFKGWTVNGISYTNADYVTDAVVSLVKNGTPVEIKPVYDRKKATYMVHVIKGNLADGSTTHTFRPAEQLYATADNAPENMKFDHWTVSYDDGKSVDVSYNMTYAFRMPAKNITLTAVYIDDNIQTSAKATAYIENITKSAENKLSFTAVMSIPEDAEMVQAGIVACKSTDLVNGHDKPTIDYARFNRYNNTTCKDYMTFKYTWTKGNITDMEEIWCVRAYVLYKDKDGNEQEPVYSDMVSAKLSDFISE